MLELFFVFSPFRDFVMKIKTSNYEHFADSLEQPDTRNQALTITIND